jgi:subtilisin family serine protease
MGNIRRVILVLLLIGMVSGCKTTPLPSPTPPIPEDELADIRQACQTQSEEGRERQLKQPEYGGLIYIESYIIATGPREQIKEVIELLELSLEQVDAIDLGSLSEYKLEEDALEFLREKQGDLLLDPAKLSETTIQLYQIGDGMSVEQVVCEINELSARAELAVFADPNYHMSPADDWAGGGSPWTQNGEWVGGLPGGGLSEAPGGDFRSQWAFRATGINLFDDQGARALGDYMGADVRIGIFDTSPFTEVGEEEQCLHCFPFDQLVGDVLGESAEAEPPLTVWHQRLIPAPSCPGYDRHSGKKLESHQDISNHGLFVAGLAHAVAPHSDIYLVRVLEDDGCGGLFTINKGIKMFMDETLQDRGTLRGTVINLSLGIHKPPKPSQFGLPEEVKSLEHMLESAVSLGAVVVAAAGNDSFDKLPPRPPNQMEIPAQYPFVIGVAASNIESERGCFSNMGDVAAPGGDGEFVGEERTCALPDCSKIPDLCLISLAQDSSTGYAYWVGTSFSTPLVSGLASLLLDAGVSPARVFDAIQSGVTPKDPSLYLGDGIINVRNSMP